MSIKPLPPDVIAQIKSSTAITSLNKAISDLMKNSLDAGATKVDISVDYGRGGCIVEDDGLGILPLEFEEKGGLGRLHHSSKFKHESPIHGRHGTFLASLSASSLLSITSHHYLHRSHNTLTMHKSTVISRQIPAPPQQWLASFDQGTRVTVRDLFGNMPVRVKMRAINSEKQSSKAWEELKRDVVMLLLSWPSRVSVTVRKMGTNQRILIRESLNAQLSSFADPNEVDISKIHSILFQASLIDQAEKSAWVPVSASTSRLEINGAISLDAIPTKQVQFLAFGIQPLVHVDGQSILHDEINRLFMNSSFGNEEGEDQLDHAGKNKRAKDERYNDDGYTSRELKGGRKGTDRWPMFYINFRLAGMANDDTLEINDVLENRRNCFSAVLELLQAMILAFLTRHNFWTKGTSDPRPSRSREQNKDEVQRTVCGSPQNEDQDMHADSKPQQSNTAKLPRTGHLDEHSTSGKVSYGSTCLDTSGREPKPWLLGRSLSRSESPFDAWPRVKSGTAVSKSNPLQRTAELSTMCVISQPQKISTAATSSEAVCKSSKCHTRSDSESRGKAEKSTKPLISTSGKVLRQPFEDTVPTNDPKHHSLESKLSLMASEVSNNNGDELIAWTNPLTQKQSLISRRTGLTLVAGKDNGGNGIAAANQGYHSSRTKLRSNLTLTRPEPSTWVGEILKSWQNPIFGPTEALIPQVSHNGTDCVAKSKVHVHECHDHSTKVDIDREFKEPSTGLHCRISKCSLKHAEVISQVDKKFILVKLHASESADDLSTESTGPGNLLVIIDQHAADERIRIESLMSELCTQQTVSSTSSPTQCRVKTIYLAKPLCFDVSATEIQHLRTHSRYFSDWGILYDLPSDGGTTSAVSRSGKERQRLTVRSLPPGICERCRLDPELLISLLRTEVHHRQSVSKLSSLPRDQEKETIDDGWSSKHHWLKKMHDCPQGIVDMLNSRACRSAIMFNDELSKDQCKILVSLLSECAFPFQCAHGRPSMVPLVDLGRLSPGDDFIAGCNLPLE